jgi:rfaE bifunctional protein nucleotidyltransferase chain/domain
VKVVLANGCFDILHLGHKRHLEAAAKLGDKLVVSVTRNRSVNKGPDRPHMDEKARAEIISAFRFVDKVILVDSSLEALKKIKPNVFAKGSQYKSRILVEDFDWCDKHDCEIVFTGPHIDSSTKYHDRLRKS